MGWAGCCEQHVPLECPGGERCAIAPTPGREGRAELIELTTRCVSIVLRNRKQRPIRLCHQSGEAARRRQGWRRAVMMPQSDIEEPLHLRLDRIKGGRPPHARLRRGTRHARPPIAEQCIVADERSRAVARRMLCREHVAQPERCRERRRKSVTLHQRGDDLMGIAQHKQRRRGDARRSQHRQPIVQQQAQSRILQQQQRCILELLDERKVDQCQSGNA